MKQIKMNSWLHVAVFVTLFWLLPSVEVASAQSKVNIVHVGGVASWSVLLPIAQEQGLFTKHGVEVQLVLVPEAEVPRLRERTHLATSEHRPPFCGLQGEQT